MIFEERKHEANQQKKRSSLVGWAVMSNQLEVILIHRKGNLTFLGCNINSRGDNLSPLEDNNTNILSCSSSEILAENTTEAGPGSDQISSFDIL